MTQTVRSRRDLCPGVLRPWLADDGALVRIRLVGGRLTTDQLSGLADLSSTYGDGNLHLTSRANVQVRGLPDEVPAEVVDRIERLGLLPSRDHELVRNITVSPLTGRLGGLADLRPVARALDELLCSDRHLANLPAKFLFCLDDGRGDLHDRPCDVGAVAISANEAQLRAGAHLWGPVVPLDEVARSMLELARRFLALRGDGPTAPWHVVELPDSRVILPEAELDGPQLESPPPPFGVLPQEDGRRAHHLPAADGVLTPDAVRSLLGLGGAEVLVTPWRSVIVPDLEPTP